MLHQVFAARNPIELLLPSDCDDLRESCLLQNRNGVVNTRAAGRLPSQATKTISGEYSNGLSVGNTMSGRPDSKINSSITFVPNSLVGFIAGTIEQSNRRTDSAMMAGSWAWVHGLNIVSD